jgi:hypothetical protein
MYSHVPFSVSCVLFVCKCVLLPPADNPFAVQYMSVDQATNHLSHHSDKLIIYLETALHLRNERMPDITYIYFIFVVGFLCSYRLICEGNFRERLGTMVINITLLTLQPEDSLPVVYRGGFNPPPRNSEVLTKPSRIPCSVENTSVTT